MFYFPEPPYFLFIASLLISLTSGAAFSGTLKLIVQKWSADRKDGAIAKFAREKLLLPYLGISAGVVLFLSSGLEIFGLPAFLAYAIAIPVALLVSLLVWFQLGSMLALVEQQGFQSIDIDSYF